MSRRIIDLSLTIREGMTTFPVHWHPFVEISQLGRVGIEGRETRKLVLGTHTGTHVDAPRHFVDGAMSVDEILLDQVIGAATVCDFSNAARFQEIGVEEFSRVLGDRPTERVLMRFDWSDQIDTSTYYSDHPFISEDVAHWLVEKGCRLLGMDTPMPDNPKHGRGCEIDSPNHKTLLGNGTILVEYLTNLRSVSLDVVELIVAPLKVEQGDGSPARVFAIEYT